MKRTFPTAAAARVSCTALCRIPARGGEHWLRGPVLRRRCGRRPMLSCRELSARAHIRRGAAFPRGAGPHTSLPQALHLFFPPGKPRQCAFLACDAMVTSFHSLEKKGHKEKGPPARRKIPVARTPGPLTLALTFPIHSGGRIKGSLACVHSSLTRLCPPCHL